MGLYPPLETIGENHRRQHVAEVRSRLGKERDFRTSLYNRTSAGGGGGNAVDGLDTGLSLAGAAMAATGVVLLTTIITAPVAIGLQAGAIACGLLAGGRFICRRLEAKARKHDQIRVLAVSKLNSIADRISAALTDDRSPRRSFARFSLRSTSTTKWRLRFAVGVRKMAGVCPRTKKAAHEPHERRGDANGPYQALGRAQSCWKQWHLSMNISCSRA